MSLATLSKKEWRVHFKKLADANFKHHNFQDENTKWLKTLSDFFKNQKGYWGVYSPLFGEPPIDKYLKTENVNMNITWLFPKIDGQDICFYQSEHFQSHPWGIQEPVDGQLILSSKISGMLIPGLGFNHKGQRLGRGKGFYDRYLQNYKGKKIGICYGFQLVKEAFPVDTWDVKMDSVLTENGIIDC